jgi:hypothetical protein
MDGEEEFSALASRITFDPTEGRTEGEEISDQYAAQGVRFTLDPTVTPTITIPQDCNNGCVEAETASAPFALGALRGSNGGEFEAPLTISFAVPQARVGMYIGNNDYGENFVRMTAFDAQGQEIYTGSQAIRGANVDTFIGIDSGNPDISRVEVETLEIGTEVPGFRFEEIDNLIFDAVDAEDMVDSDWGGVGPDDVTPAAPLSSTYDVTVRAADDRPNQLRAAFLAGCDGVKAVLATGLPPTTVESGIARFDYDFDTETTCTNGDIATIIAKVNDGFQVSAPEARDVDATDAPPIAVVSAPTPGAHILEHEAIALDGQGLDLSDGDVVGSSLAWHMTPPGGTESLVGTGRSVTLEAPATGWEPGLYSARLVATDEAGNADESIVTFTIDRDGDNDGVIAAAESCAGGSDTDPFDAFADGDQDGVSNGGDEDPCDPRDFYEGLGDFDPDNLFVPSSGTPVTMYVSLPQRDLTQVDPASVRIAEIRATDVRSEPLTALSWQVVDRRGVAKFDRQVLTEWMHGHGFSNGVVRIAIEGRRSGGEWSFIAEDRPLVRDR